MITYDDLLEQNPWWQGGQSPEEASLPRRTCFKNIHEGLERTFVQVLLGIRRVGKSTVLRQLIADLLKVIGIESGADRLYFEVVVCGTPVPKGGLTSVSLFNAIHANVDSSRFGAMLAERSGSSS